MKGRDDRGNLHSTKSGNVGRSNVITPHDGWLCLFVCVIIKSVKKIYL